MTDSPPPDRASSEHVDDDEDTAHDVLEAFNAGGVLDRAGEPPQEEVSTIGDTDIPPPG